jgi:hypothetical protein
MKSTTNFIFNDQTSMPSPKIAQALNKQSPEVLVSVIRKQTEIKDI